MNKKLIYFFGILILASFIAACGGTTEPSANGTNAVNGVNAPNTNAPVNKVNGPLTTVTATPAATTNNAPTLSPVYKAYCAAWVKNDEAALRKIYSTDTIKEFEKQMKEENVKTLVKFLSDDQASNELCEARNETITGDSATAEVRTKGYPNGIVIIFVKEGGEWKMTNRRPEGSLK
ncbi:MAG TPA: hypothetical protein VK612_00715 [Pyrinomonadaceae bacterium]|nr:hypothetical protein [Pyrinomonadaceae bacterium]